MTQAHTSPGRNCFAWFNAHAPGHDPVNAYLLALASIWVYPSIVTRCVGCDEKESLRRMRSSFAHWGIGDSLRFISRTAVGRYDTQALVAANEDIVLVVFRGSETPQLPSSRVVNAIRDWLVTDADIRWTTVSDLGREVDVHRGFWRAFDAVAEDVQTAVLDAGPGARRLWITGHSMGGALATLAAPWLCARDIPVAGVYTFGAPMVGGIRFANLLGALPIPALERYVCEGDPIPELPPEPLEYQHAARPHVVCRDGSIARDAEDPASNPDMRRHSQFVYGTALYDALTDAQKRFVPPPPTADST